MRRAWWSSLATLVAFGVGCSSSSDASSNGGDAANVDTSNDETIVDGSNDTSIHETSGDVAIDAPGDAPTDATTDGADGAPCNTLDVPTSTIGEVQVASSPPTMTGGTIADGTYVLTSQQKFTGSGGATGPDGIDSGQTIVFSAGTSAQSVATLLGTTARWNALYTAGGTDLALKPTCGTIGGDPAIFKYSATSTELQLFVESQSILETFTLK